MAEKESSAPGALNQEKPQPPAITKQLLPEKSRNGVKIGPKYQAYNIMRENGMRPGEASKALGMSYGYGYDLEKRIDKRYDLTSAKFIKLASKAVKNLVQAQPFGSIEKVKDSTALQAAQMVYDRVQPVIQRSITLNANLDIHPVDLGDFL